jgi:hypothetical protein
MATDVGEVALSPTNTGDHPVGLPESPHAKVRTRALALDELLASEPAVDFMLLDTQGSEGADRRSRAPEFRGRALSHSLATADRLRPIAGGLGCSLAEVAVAWVLAREGVDGAAVGAPSGPQVDAWARAARVTLDAQALQEIAQATASHAGRARGGALRCVDGRFRVPPPYRKPRVDQPPTCRICRRR